MFNEEEKNLHICYNCEAEFIVHTPYDSEEEISFCPFCGSEIEGFDDDEDEDDVNDTLVFK